jgi:tetratricopeptide (TPR) repeat protein
MKLLAKIETYILYATIILLPLASFPISPNPYAVSKLAVLFAGIGAFLIVKSIKTIIEGKLTISTGKFDLPVLIIAIAYIVSTFLRTQNKMEAVLLPGSATIAVGAALLYFLVNQLSKKDKGNVAFVLLVTGSIYSAVSLLSTTGILAKIPQLPAFIRAQNFTPEGGYLPSVIILATILPLGIGLFISEKVKNQKAILGGLLALVIVGLGLSVYRILPGKPLSPRFPPLSTSWFIAVDTLKQSPLLGAGPGNYLTAFNRFRPITYNATDLWALKFSTATNHYLTILTEAGLLGAAGLILLFMAIYKTVRKDLKEKKLVGWGFAGTSSIVSLGLIIIFLGLFPATTTLVALLFIILSLNTANGKSTIKLTSEVTNKDLKKTEGIASRFPAILITLPVIALVIYTSFHAVRFLGAELTFRQALAELARNEGVKSYESMRSAINANPLVDRYHASYSQVNLALANAIAANAQNPEVEITDQDRTNIAQLIQQAIREGKATVALNPLRAGNWEILARTYRTIIPLAQGADVFAAQSFDQALALDPFNPNTRIALGGLYYAAGNFDTAIRVFELAVASKPDLANAHYNLAFAYREAGRVDESINQLSLVLSLIDQNTNDYQVAKNALEELQKQKTAGLEATGAKEAAPQGQELIPPQDAPEPIITPPIDLPTDAEPPEAPLTPTPTPEEFEEGEEGAETTPTVTPQITPTPIP